VPLWKPDGLGAPGSYRVELIGVTPLVRLNPILVSTLLQLHNNLGIIPANRVGGTQASTSLDPVLQQCVRKTFSDSFVPQPEENNTYMNKRFATADLRTLINKADYCVF
jgi:hypothetical protein